MREARAILVARGQTVVARRMDMDLNTYFDRAYLLTLLSYAPLVAEAMQYWSSMKCYVLRSADYVSRAIDASPAECLVRQRSVESEWEQLDSCLAFLYFGSLLADNTAVAARRFYDTQRPTLLFTRMKSRYEALLPADGDVSHKQLLSANSYKETIDCIERLLVALEPLLPPEPVAAAAAAAAAAATSNPPVDMAPAQLLLEMAVAKVQLSVIPDPLPGENGSYRCPLGCTFGEGANRSFTCASLGVYKIHYRKNHTRDFVCEDPACRVKAHVLAAGKRKVLTFGSAADLEKHQVFYRKTQNKRKSPDV